MRALLEPGADTRNLDALPGVERVPVDVCDAGGMRRALEGCDVLYHLAAIYKTWAPNPDSLYRVNIEGTTTTLLAAQQANLRKPIHQSIQRDAKYLPRIGAVSARGQGHHEA